MTNRKQRREAARMQAATAPVESNVVSIPPNLTAVPAKKKFKITANDVATLRAHGRAKQQAVIPKTTREIFAAYEPTKGVIPSGRTGKTIAMDAGFGFGDTTDLGLLDNINAAFADGYAFPGFQVLAQWSQIPEFRRPAEVFAREMTRKWITFKAVGEEDKSERIKLIEKEFKRLNVQAIFRKAIEHDGFFGRSHIFLDMGAESNDLVKGELQTELVESPDKIGVGQLKRLTVVEAMWVYPNRYNANDPTDETFYKPMTWFVMSKEIHNSRLLTIVTRQLPDVLKPSYAFAGLSLSQMIKPYVDNWLRTRQSVSDLVHAFTVWTLSTDMSEITTSGGMDDFYNRLEFFNVAHDNHGINAVNRDTEEFGNVSASLGSLDKLQAQSQEQMCAPVGQPLVYLTGITPAGLNASSQDEIEVFQDTCAANQEIYTPILSKIMNIVQLNIDGVIDPDIGFEWNKLKVVTEKEQGEIEKLNRETDIASIDAGILTPDEVRTAIATEESSRYSGLDLNVVITPPEDPAKDPAMQDFSERMGSSN